MTTAPHSTAPLCAASNTRWTTTLIPTFLGGRVIAACLGKLRLRDRVRQGEVLVEWGGKAQAPSAAPITTSEEAGGAHHYTIRRDNSSKGWAVTVGNIGLTAGALIHVTKTSGKINSGCPCLSPTVLPCVKSHACFWNWFWLFHV